MENYRILVINPGSTSTKIGIYDNERCVLEKTLRHNSKELQSFPKIIDQYEFRKQVILETLDYEGINLSKLSGVCGRGGLLKPIPGGTYEVNEEMLKDLREGYNGHHASNLGGILAKEIGDALNIPAFIVDPVVVDELHPLARLSGVPEIERKSIFHALNQKAVARQIASQIGKKYEECRFVVAHMGGGISVGVHENGRVIDVNNGLDGEGPYSPERAGTVPAGDLVDLCFSEHLYQEEILKKLVGKGGLVGYLGTSDAREIEERITKGDLEAKHVYDGMAYNIAKEIGRCSVVLKGKIDGVILTGGLAFSHYLVNEIRSYISWLGEIYIFPGEYELQALAEGALRVLREEEKVKIYPYTKAECDASVLS